MNPCLAVAEGSECDPAVEPEDLDSHSGSFGVNSDSEVPGAATPAEWGVLENHVRSHAVKGTRLRTNLAPDAPRDKWGYLKDPIPSERIRDGPIFDACKKR